MSAPARATAGVAFRLAGGPLLDEEADRQACAAWWTAHVELLRRLLASQPVGGYPNHSAHIAVLKAGEAWVSHYSGGPKLTRQSSRIMREDIEEVLADFGPRDYRFGEHLYHQGVYGWWPRLDETSMIGLSGRQVAERIEIKRRIEALADIQATLPPEVPGTPALPQPTAPAVETAEKKLARLKRQLVPLAAVYHYTPPAKLPQDVINILVDIAETTGDMAHAITAWHEACDAVGEE